MTVVSPEEPDEAQLVLEPNDDWAAKAYQEATYKQGIRATTFPVNDIQKEYQRLKSLGVRFITVPTK